MGNSKTSSVNSEKSRGANDPLFRFQIISYNKYPKSQNQARRGESGVIAYKNILRSKNQLERLIKCNYKDLHTFITLTFENPNLGSLDNAMDQFRSWYYKIKKYLDRYNKKNNTCREFKYVCVPEIQKKREKKEGIAVIHYHLLSNLDINIDKDILPLQKYKRKCYDVKYWNYGFSSVYRLTEPVQIFTYLSKYLTKDIDQRFFGKRRYYYSSNLKHPREIFINLDESIDTLLYLRRLNQMDKTYENTYLDKFGNLIKFIEYRKTDN